MKIKRPASYFQSLHKDLTDKYPQGKYDYTYTRLAEMKRCFIQVYSDMVEAMMVNTEYATEMEKALPLAIKADEDFHKANNVISRIQSAMNDPELDVEYKLAEIQRCLGDYDEFAKNEIQK